MKRLKSERRGEERGELGDTRDKEGGIELHSASHPQKEKKTKQNKTDTLAERLVGRTEPRVKGERKGLFCAFHPSGA